MFGGGCADPSLEVVDGSDPMKPPLIGKQFSLCPDTGELEASRRSQEKLHRQQQQQAAEAAAAAESEEGLSLGTAFAGSDLVDAKLLASLSFENLDLKLEEAASSELLEQVVKSEGGDGFSDAVALAALGGEVGVKREPGGFDDESPAKVRRVVVNDAALQQLLSAAGQVVTLPSPQPVPQPAQSNQTRFLIAWKAENNELVPVCIPVQTGADGGQGNIAQMVQHAPAPQQSAPTVIQLPASGIIPALAQGATLQIPAGNAFPGLSQALQIPSSGILHASGGQGTVLQLPGDLGQAPTVLQLPGPQTGPFPGKQDEMEVPEEEEVVEKPLTEDVSSSSLQEPPQAPATVEEPEPEMENEEEQDAESWRLRHAVTILEKSQINFLRDARRSFKCYQCGGLIRPPALEVEVDLAPYGIRPVLCTDCGKFHLNKRNVNVRVTTDEGCEQLHRFMSA